MPRTIKTTLELGGEAAYKKGLQSIDNALKAMSKELSEATARFAENSTSLKNVSALSDSFKNSVEQQKIKVDSLKGAVESSSKAYEEAVKKYEDAAAASGENSTEALKAADALYKAGAALDSYKSKLSTAEKYLDSSQKKMKEFTDENKNIIALADTVNKVKEKATYLSNGLVILVKNTKAFQAGSGSIKKVKDEFSKLSEKVTDLGNKFPKTAKTISTAGKAISTPFKAIKPLIQNLSGAFQLAAKKAGEIKDKLKPAINVCKNVAKAAGQITFKTAEIGAKAVSKSVKTAAAAFTAYTTAAAGAVTATMSTIESTREYRNDLSKLEQGAATSGNSFSAMKNELVNLTALTGESDSSIEALSNLMSTGFSDEQVTQAVDALSGAVIKFPDTLKIESLADSLQETVATGAGTGQFAELIERNGDSLDDFNAGLEACTSEAERQQYALEYLEKSGLSNVNSAYEKSHKTLLDYEKAEQAVTDANAKIAESAMPIATGFKKGYAGVLSAFSDVLSGADKIGARFGQKITSFINNISKTITQYAPTMLTAVNTIITTVIANLPTLMNAILPSLLTGFNQLITGLIAILPELMPLLLEGFLTLFGSLIDSINLVLEQLMPMLPEIITQITTALIENLPLLLEGAMQLFLGLIQALDQVVEQLMPMLPTLITNLCDTLIQSIPAIISAGFDLLIGLVEGITNCIPTLVQKIPEVVGSITNAFSNNIGQLITAGIELIVALATGLPKAIPQLIAAIPEIITSIISAFMNQDWLQVGIDILRGIADGLVEGVSFIWDKICEMGEKIMDSVKSFFGIKSPSRLFRDEVGTYLAQGIGVGFENEMSKVTKDMQKAVPSDFDTVVNADINSFRSAPSAQSITKNSNMTVNYIFENVIINSDEDIEEYAYKLEAMRQKAALAIGGV